MRLRPATEADAEFLMAWRNDPDTVRFSRSARPVTAAEHREWLRERLADQSSRVWVGEETGHPVGQVRVNREEGVWIVDIAVAPGDRGRGLSTDLLRNLQREMPGCTGAGTLRAEVHRDNLASKRAFASAGFVRGGEAGGFVRYEWEW